MTKTPTFMGGPKDGAVVPDVLWVLDVIDLTQTIGMDTYVYRYQLDYDDKQYYYKGMVDDTSAE